MPFSDRFVFSGSKKLFTGVSPKRVRYHRNGTDLSGIDLHRIAGQTLLREISTAFEGFSMFVEMENVIAANHPVPTVPHNPQKAV
jgi:hypothetical protein